MRAWGWVIRVAAACVLCLAVAAPALAGEVRFGDGGWSWFQDPRAVTYAGVHNRTYVGYVTPAGDVTRFLDKTCATRHLVSVRLGIDSDDPVIVHAMPCRPQYLPHR